MILPAGFKAQAKETLSNEIVENVPLQNSQEQEVSSTKKEDEGEEGGAGGNRGRVESKIKLTRDGSVVIEIAPEVAAETQTDLENERV